MKKVFERFLVKKFVHGKYCTKSIPKFWTVKLLVGNLTSQLKKCFIKTVPTRHSFKHTFCREIALLSNLRGALEIIHQNQSKVKFRTNEGNFCSPEQFFRIGSPLLLSERDKKEYTYLQTAVIVYGKSINNTCILSETHGRSK